MDTTIKELAEKLRHGEAVIEELEARGAAAVKELVLMLKAANDDETVTASFALEGLTMHLSRPGAETDCRAFASALASCLEDDSCADDVARAVVVKALHLCGGNSEVKAVAAQLDRAKVRDAAILALTAIGTEDARQALVAAAAAAESRVALEYVSAFATLREVRAAELLMKLWRIADAYHRCAIMNALAAIGYAEAAPGLLKALNAEVETERAAARGAIARLVKTMADRKAAAELARSYDELQPGEASIAVLLDCLGIKAVLPRMIDEITRGDFVRREAMLTLLLGEKDETVVPALITAGAWAAPDVLAAIVRMLGRKGDMRAKAFVFSQTRNMSACVRQAAYEALPSFSVPEAVNTLTAGLTRGRDEDAAVIRNVLNWQAYAPLVAKVAGAAGRAQGASKAAVLDILAARGAFDCKGLALDSLKDSEPIVRIAALKCLNVLGEAKDVNAVLPALVSADKDEADAASATLVTLGKMDADAVKGILDAYQSGDDAMKTAVLGLLSDIGGELALTGVANGIESDNANVSAVALKALAAWPDACAQDLLEKTAGTASAENRELLLKGLFRVAALTEGRTVEACAEKLAALSSQCASADERRWLLEAIGDIRCDDTVTKLIMPTLEDSELAEAGAAAAVKVICSRGGKDTGLTSEAARVALEAVKAVAKDTSVLEAAERQLKEMLTAEGAEEQKIRAAYAF